MFKTALKLIAADIALVVAALYVVQDLQWRSAYAATARQVCGGSCSYTPSFSYGFLTQFFTMTGSSAQLTSPPMLDWVQALVFALVVLNGWFAYSILKSRSAKRALTATGETSR